MFVLKKEFVFDPRREGEDPLGSPGRRELRRGQEEHRQFDGIGVGLRNACTVGFLNTK